MVEKKSPSNDSSAPINIPYQSLKTSGTLMIFSFFIFSGFPAAAYAAYAAGRGFSGYPSFGLPYPTGNNNLNNLASIHQHLTNNILSNNHHIHTINNHNHHSIHHPLLQATSTCYPHLYHHHHHHPLEHLNIFSAATTHLPFHLWMNSNFRTA